MISCTLTFHHTSPVDYNYCVVSFIIIIIVIIVVIFIIVVIIIGVIFVVIFIIVIILILLSSLPFLCKFHDINIRVYNYRNPRCSHVR